MTDAEPPPDGDQPLRVSTLELFFDLVFVFAITQLTGILARDMTLAAGLRVLLIFGVLWWMYGGYVWLSNARTPSRTPERLLMLVGMAGFLIVGLAIPQAFGRDGVAFGLGYLIVVGIHTWLYHRVNKNIARVAPFNVAAALLIIGAGLRADPAARPALALAAYFYAYIPMLLGIVALSAGVKQAIVSTRTATLGSCAALACGVALFIVGSAAFRRALRIGVQKYRLAAAAVSLAACVVGVTVSVAAEIALLTLIVAAALAVEGRPADTVEP
jgi:low temperature requirement protein LtrA